MLGFAKNRGQVRLYKGMNKHYPSPAPFRVPWWRRRTSCGSVHLAVKSLVVAEARVLASTIIAKILFAGGRCNVLLAVMLDVCAIVPSQW